MKTMIIALLLAAAIFLAALFAGSNGLYRTYGDTVSRQETDIYEDVFFSYEVIRYPASVEIINRTQNYTVGVDVGTDRLDFGLIPAAENFVTKHINLENKLEGDAKVRVSGRGNIAGLLDFSQDSTILTAKERTTVDVVLTASNTTFPGNYTGEIDVRIIRPSNFIGDILFKVV